LILLDPKSELQYKKHFCVTADTSTVQKVSLKWIDVIKAM